MADANTKYPYGYTKDASGEAGMGTMITMEQYEKKKTVYMLNPEFWRRFRAFMEFAADNGVPIGVGTGWRIQPNPPPPGFASPGNSNHEGFPADGEAGGAVAIDMVPTKSWKWMEPQLAKFGLRSFLIPSTTGYKGKNEPWHIQPAEIPASRSKRTQPWNLQKFPLPSGGTAPPPKPPTPPTPTGNWAKDVCNKMPTLTKGAKGVYVKRMQHFLAYAGQMDPTNMANFDGVFGSGTEGALNRFLATGSRPQNGTCDPYVWNWFMDTGNGVQSLKKGASGGDVTRMQRMLSANGFMEPSNQANFDGQFGSGTEGAVKKFQQAKGLGVDGQCGQQTWTKLLTG